MIQANSSGSARIADHFYTLTQTAQKLGVNRLTVRRWIKAGQLEAQRIGGVVLIERGLVDAKAGESS